MADVLKDSLSVIMDTIIAQMLRRFNEERGISAVDVAEAGRLVCGAWLGYKARRRLVRRLKS
jgi:hypothetical protein